MRTRAEVREPTVTCCQHTLGLVQVSPELEVAEVWGGEKEGAILAQEPLESLTPDPSDPNPQLSI